MTQPPEGFPDLVQILADARAIALQADRPKAEAIYLKLVAVMETANPGGAEAFMALVLLVATWVSGIPCSGCRAVEMARMATLAQATADRQAELNGGDDGDYHATRH